MHRNSRIKIVSGAMAILLVLAAVVWVMGLGRTTSGQIDRSSYAAGPSGVTTNSGQATPSPVSAGPIVVLPEKVDLSPPLRDIPPRVPEKAEELLIRFNEMGLPGREEGGFDGVDHGLQDWQGAIEMPSPIQNWEGLGNIDNGAVRVLPPDTQGDVGPNHYVQWVNSVFAVYNKTGTRQYGPTTGSTLWSGFGGACETENDGDIITIYDHLANRWFMSQFAIPTSAPFYQCIAVSQGADPTGSWYRYSYQWPNSYMNDYPHFGLWPDGYYLTVNQFSGSSWAGAGVAAFERSRMLLGQTAQMIYFNLGTAYGGQLPADLEGITAPPSGALNYILEWDNGIPNDALRIWQFHVDWVTPANSTLVLGYTLTTNNVDTDLCAEDRERCIPQPGTNVRLEAISDRLMHRVQYRNMGNRQVMVANHTVDTNNPAGTAGIHWFELRNTSGTWSIYQQGTYGPADGVNRWMGSIAMDHVGNIALAYSVSNSTNVYPGIRYVGRVSSDALGTMGQGETVLQAGSGSQTHATYGARWGDYSALQLDPSNPCAFWYTTEYYQTTHDYNWQTRVGSFAFTTAQCNPTYVRLARFEGWPERAAVHVEWETVSEVNNLGFNLYRADAADGPYMKLNEELIPSQVPGQPGGAVYVWTDSTVQVGRTYYYKLEDVDIYGYTTLHGPVRVKAWPTLRGKP